jgi:hypothetical protein
MSTLRNTTSHSALYPLAILERLLPRRARMGIAAGSGALALILFFGAAAFHTHAYGNIVAGLGLILLGCTLILFMAELFFRSLYFHARGTKTTEGAEELISLGVLSVIEGARRNDLVRALFRSPIGTTYTRRLGLSPKEVHTFLVERGARKTELSFTDTDHSPWYSLEDFVAELIAVDEPLSDFLFSKGITRSVAARAAGWCGRMREQELDAMFWWDTEKLLSKKTLGATFHKKRTDTLDAFLRTVPYASQGNMLGKNTLSRVWGGLSKSHESNVLVVGPFDAPTFLGSLTNELRHRYTKEKRDTRIVLLDTDLLITETGDKITFERTLRTLLEEAREAGNIIIGIPRFHAFITSAHTIGADIRSILDPFLTDSSLACIAFSDERTYTRELERDMSLMRRFEIVRPPRVTSEDMLAFLETDVSLLEKKHSVFFTYPAIDIALSGAERYFMSEDPADKARDLISEAAARAHSEKERIITPEIIRTLISEKSSVPIDALSESERLILADLETHLHKHVVGQESAISAIAQALRRARAGVGDTHKPIGSFIFFGPTGVGKTETAKALSRVMFGGESSLLRLDMSEYRGHDALARLIGSGAGEAGMLATMIRKNPHGVLLLDEFEKTNPDVHDLFLQILDEGIFTDGEGRRVNARNILFIATSNAGSDRIWKATEEGLDVSEEHDAFIAHIIEHGLFKPELLNRFSGTILFHPLSPEDVEAIAHIMLRKVVLRIEEEGGVRVSFSPDMPTHVAREGYDRAFGARPMKRYIEQHIEQYVADGLIKGKIARGGSITLSPKDIA